MVLHTTCWFDITEQYGFLDAGNAPAPEVRRADTRDDDCDVLAHCVSTLEGGLQEVITGDLRHQRYRDGSLMHEAPLRSVVRWPQGTPVDREGEPPARA